MGFYLQDVRRAQTVAELDRLAGELALWAEHRRLSDPRGQYQTQIGTIVNEVSSAVTAVREAVNQVPNGRMGSAFRELAAHDRRIIWIRTVWDYFREKFDQRDDPVLRPVLLAADEVVWSCFKPFFAGPGRRMPPAPLACVDRTYAPSAVNPDQAAQQFSRNTEIDHGPLAAHLRSLPVPILRLPPSVVTAPWHLALIGHEVGHFAQRMAANAPELFDWTIERIDAAVAGVGGTEEDRAAWTRCADEIFADWYLVLTMGAWAVWAIAPWVIGPEAQMLSRQRHYPSPVARLCLLAATAEALGLAAAENIRAQIIGEVAVTGGSAQQDLDLRAASAVARIVLMPAPGDVGQLTERTGFRASHFERDGTVARWSRGLLAAAPMVAEQKLRSARLMAAAASAASYAAAMLAEDHDREQGLKRLREASPARISDCFECGHRAAPADAAARAGPDLARLLLDTPDDRLMD